MVGGLRVCFPKVFVICCSVCRPRLALDNCLGLCVVGPKIEVETRKTMCWRIRIVFSTKPL